MSTHMTMSGTRALCVLVLCVVALFASACADMGMSEVTWDSAQRPEAYDDELILQAERSLTRHDLVEAQRLYGDALSSQDPRVEGTAAAGKALMDTFLFAGDEAARALLVEYLGAQNRRYDVERLIWSENGVLYWLSEGVRWEDDGNFQGVRSIVADELPWSLERLDSIEAFIEGLDQPGDVIIEALIDVAEDMRDIERDLEVAIYDPKFAYLYLPADVFHDETLSMAIGKSELAAAHGVLSLGRAAIYLAAAYQHPWTIEEGFTPTSPEQDAVDHAYAYFDARLGRALVGEGGDDQLRRSRLSEARLAARNGFFYLHEAISIGLETKTSDISVLRWDRVDRDLARDLREILQGLERAVDGPEEIPHFAPALTVDLSVFFDGRVLDDEIAWFEQVDGEQGATWQLTEEATQAFFLDGVLDPPATAGEEYEVELDLADGAIDTFVERLVGPISERLEDAYAGGGLID